MARYTGIAKKVLPRFEALPCGSRTNFGVYDNRRFHFVCRDLTEVAAKREASKLNNRELDKFLLSQLRRII